MKTLLIENPDLKKIGELYSASSIINNLPDLLVVGDKEIPGKYNKTFIINEKIGANLLNDIAKLIEHEKYDIIFLTSSLLGSYIGAPLAGKLSIPIVSEITGIGYDQGSIYLERPIYGGKAIIKYKLKKTPCIITIRRKYFENAILEGDNEFITIKNKNIPINKIELIEENEQTIEGISLEDADIIITGGRGIGSKKDFETVMSFAEILKGAVGASRGAVDEGWVPAQMQIGQTGKIVAPSLYFAIGVSGASQHLAGITNAKCVIAINTDEDANIFKRARFGIVGDYKKVIPSIIKRFKEIM